MSTPAPVRGGTLRPYPGDRLADFVVRYRGAGRRWRGWRRAAALALIVAAGTVAAVGRLPATAGTPVLVAARDIATGATLTPADVRAGTRLDSPDGALRGDAAAGRVAAGPIRRGEILTDARLVPENGPRPGPGRSAVAVRSIDPALVDLLSPGMRLAVLGIDPDGAALPLTDEALVLWVPPTAPAGPAPASTRTVLLSVPEAVAEQVATTALTGTIGVRFPPTQR